MNNTSRRGWLRLGKSAWSKLGVIFLGLFSIIFLLLWANRNGGAQSQLPSDELEVGPSLRPFPGQNLWFVGLRSAPLSEVKGKADRDEYLLMLNKEKEAFRNSASQAGILFRERLRYDILWNGLSVEIDPSRAASLLNLPDVVDIYPVSLVQAPPQPIADPSGGIEPDMLTAVNMTGVTAAHDSGYTGEGVRIAIIDSGVDYNHPDLGGPGFPNSRIAGGYDLVGDYYAPGVIDPPAPYYNSPQPDPDPMDCYGHGTHVAGIVGADGKLRVTGVAPKASLYMYKIMGCLGWTTADVILAALEMAMADGCQVINMSLGSSYGWPQNPLARASDNLVNNGIVVVASAGNSGSDVFSMSSPGTGNKVIGVGSANNTHILTNRFSIPWDLWRCLPGYWCPGCGERPWIYYQPAYNSPPLPISGSEPLVYVNCACSQFFPLQFDVAGKVAVIQGYDRKSWDEPVPCRDWEQINNLKNAGATAVLMYVKHWSVDNCNPIELQIGDGSGQWPILPIRVACIPRIQGEALNIIKSTTLTWGRFEPYGRNAGVRSGFSSVGPSPDLAFKPDLLAPGGAIYSTYMLPIPGQECDPWAGCPPQWFAVGSGTSMSAPHVAGAAAILLEARPQMPSQHVRDVLQNTAVPLPGRLDRTNLDAVHGQGAGLLDINAAIHARTVVTPGKISLGDTRGKSVTRTLMIKNENPDDITYELSHQPALANKPHTPPYRFIASELVSNATLSFSASSLRVRPGRTVSFDITFAEPEGLPEGGLFGGFVVVTPKNGSQVIRVPYMGYKGDYQAVTIFTEGSSYGNPLLRATNSWGPSQPATIDLTNGSTTDDRCYLMFHLEFPARKFVIEVLNQSGGPRPIVNRYDYVERNQTGYYYVMYWDGTAGGSLLPSGMYSLRLSALKPLGDDENPAHWETWTSPSITIIR